MMQAVLSMPSLTPCALDAKIELDRRLNETLEVMARAIFESSRTLAALRDVLLPKLLSGELRVQDAERFLAGAPV